MTNQQLIINRANAILEFDTEKIEKTFNQIKAFMQMSKNSVNFTTEDRNVVLKTHRISKTYDSLCEYSAHRNVDTSVVKYHFAVEMITIDSSFKYNIKIVCHENQIVYLQIKSVDKPVYPDITMKFEKDKFTHDDRSDETDDDYLSEILETLTYFYRMLQL